MALLVAVLLRRRRRMAGTVTGPRPSTGAGARAPAVVEERRRFLARSLADADAEYLAGDLSDQDYLALRRRDMVRLAALPLPQPDRRAPRLPGIWAGAGIGIGIGGDVTGRS